MQILLLLLVPEVLMGAVVLFLLTRMRKCSFLSILLALLPWSAKSQIPAPQINLTGNIGCQGFPCVNNGTLNLTSDADHTMTAQETSAFYIKVTSSVSLTTIRTLHYPAGNFPVGVENATTGGQAIAVCPVSGSCVQVPNSTSTYTQVWYDGTNFVQIGASSGGLVSSVFGRTGAVTAQTGDYAVGQITGAAPLASPALTGVPTAPTAANGTNTTQIATTAFVLANAGSSSPLTTKGDLYTFGSSNTRLPVGADGTTLVADSTQTTGLRWGSSTVTLSPFIAAATCQGGAAFGYGLSVLDNNAPAPGCYASSVSTDAYLSFSLTPAQPQYAAGKASTPAYWDGTDITLYYTSNVTSGNFTWNVQSYCPAATGSAPGSPSFGTAVTATVTVPGTAGQQGSVTLANVATNGVNGCPSASNTTAGELEFQISVTAGTATGSNPVTQLSGYNLATHQAHF
jgi:hypothetical protein